MSSQPWESVAFYCLFMIFAFSQKKHLQIYEISSRALQRSLQSSLLLGSVAFVAYLVYYGIKVAWWAPVVPLLLGGAVAGVIHFWLARFFGLINLSLAGFAAWPVCAYFMFANVSSAST